MAVNRVTTGIDSLDELLQGGLPENSVTLLSGPAGSGKSLFGMQFLHKNALKRNTGAYFSFEEDVSDLKTEAAQIGVDFRKVGDSVEFYKMSPFDYDQIISDMEKTLSKKKIKVAVLDSISTLASFSNHYTTSMPDVLNDKEVQLRPEMKLQGEAAIKAMLFDLLSVFKKAGVTAIWLSELPKESIYYSRDTESEFLADGVIVLNRIPVRNNTMRLLSIEKMRKTSHSLTRYPMEISDKGIQLLSPEKAIIDGKI